MVVAAVVLVVVVVVALMTIRPSKMFSLINSTVYLMVENCDLYLSDKR